MSVARGPAETPGAGGRRALGYLAAMTAVLITAVYPALTRASVTTTLTPADLLLFRLGISGLLFAPFLVVHARRISSREWKAALPLSFLHGWGMAGCVIVGLSFAPASHAAALGPGAIAAWIALIGFVLYGTAIPARTCAGIATIAAGVALILATSYHGPSLGRAMIGDGMFVVASALGATYLVYLQRHGLDPIVAAALVSVASAMLVIPWHLFFASSTIAAASLREVVAQCVIQGVLLGCCAFLALNYATLAIGSLTVGVLSALVPVFGGLASIVVLREHVSLLEWVAIAIVSAGVLLASFPAVGRQRLAQAARAAPSGGRTAA